MTDDKVIIIGAGVAGLYAAWLLAAAKVPYEIIEARARLGGRVLTVNETNKLAQDGITEDGFDLGPSWFWPQNQPAIGRLVAQLKLPAFAQNCEGDVIFERMSRETFQRYRSGAQDQQSMRLVGGTGALVRALAQELSPADISLNTRVTAMELVGDTIELSMTQADGTTQTRQTKHVIAALPPRLLQHSVLFNPSLDAATAQLWRDTPTWMAPHAKFIAVYNQAFWRADGLSGTAQSMVGPMAEIHDASTASGTAALFGFIGVGAEQRAAVGEASLIGACVSQLVRIFGEQAASPRATLLKDWATDDLTTTPADRAMSGHPHSINHAWVSGMWAGKLTLAGSETSPQEPGYLAGAVLAAERAVGEITNTRAAAKAALQN
ncbi:MAG: FAD-dependent oxidoreductase [Acidocella sp.]|nr:FAD-dependent oxidoreductase [Acidocella sp.]